MLQCCCLVLTVSKPSCQNTLLTYSVLYRGHAQGGYSNPQKMYKSKYIPLGFWFGHSCFRVAYPAHSRHYLKHGICHYQVVLYCLRAASLGSKIYMCVHLGWESLSPLLWCFHVHVWNVSNCFFCFSILACYRGIVVEVCVAEWWTPQTLDLEVWGSNLAHCIVSLDKELYSTLSLFTQVYKWVLATYCWGVTPRWTSIPSRGEEQHS